MLGNSRLVFIPIIVAGYLAWRLPRARATAVAVAVVLAGAGVAVAPWLVRNKVNVGCWAITTDGRAMWKANNPQTYGLLSNGQWIDDVKHPPRQAGQNYYTPDDAYGYYEKGCRHSHAISIRTSAHRCRFSSTGPSLLAASSR